MMKMTMTMMMIIMMMMMMMIIAVTQSILKLGPQDFAWKYIFILQVRLVVFGLEKRGFLTEIVSSSGAL